MSGDGCLASGGQVLMTRARFEAWLRDSNAPIYRYPFVILPCDCRDVNCHGWRLSSGGEP